MSKIIRKLGCWDCGNIFEQENHPYFCPKCRNVHFMNSESYFVELYRSREPLLDDELRQFPLSKYDNIFENNVSSPGNLTK
jgi:predicted Zn-ribbon and HTH transcriptional regulator